MENFINISVMGHDFYKYKYQKVIRNKTKVKYQKKQNPNTKYQRKKIQSQMLRETKAYRWTIIKK